MMFISFVISVQLYSTNKEPPLKMLRQLGWKQLVMNGSCSYTGQLYQDFEEKDHI